MVRIRRTLLILCVALAAPLVACTGAPGEEGTPSPTPSASSGDGGAAAPIVDQTVTPSPTSADDTTELGIVSLAVEGEIMILRYVATPDFTSASDSEEIGLADLVGSGVNFPQSQIKLLDRANLKEYSVLYADNTWWGTSGTSTVNGSPTYAYAVFAAPEDDIDSIDVSFNPQFEAFADVPIDSEEE